jgi:hypothetical protein
LARIDADDIAMPDRLATQWAFMRDRPEITVVGSDMATFGANNINTDVPEHDAQIKALFFAAAGNILNPTSCFRKEFVFANNIKHNPSYSAAEDLAFWIDCMRAGAQFANIKQLLVRYRIHGNNLTRSAKPFLSRILTGLAGDFFPWLTHHEAVALARLLVGGNFTLANASETLTACTRAITRHASVFGEDRKVLSAVVDGRAKVLSAALQQAISKSGTK